MEDMKVNKQKQRDRIDGGWKKERDIYLNDKYNHNFIFTSTGKVTTTKTKQVKMSKSKL